MNFHPPVFPEKKVFRKYSQKGVFLGTYPLIFTLFGQSYDQKILFKSRLYMPQNSGVSKKFKTFKILVIYLLETW